MKTYTISLQFEMADIKGAESLLDTLYMEAQLQARNVDAALEEKA